MPRYSVMIAQFPYASQTHTDVSDWVAETVCKLRDDPRIGHGNVHLWRKADTPITMTRNACLLAAERMGCDYVLMVDSDMCPDLPYPGAKPFWDTSFAFMLAHPGPCVVAAPYCGPPPNEAVYAFRWETQQTALPPPNRDTKLEAYGRSEAAGLTGILPAAALATGLMLIDMRAIQNLPHPRFTYEWVGDGPRCECCGQMKPGQQAQKASTEDVVFSRNLTLAGVPIYCNWDAWAGHWKPKLVVKPQAVPADAVPAWLVERAREIAANGQAANDPGIIAATNPPSSDNRQACIDRMLGAG